MKVAINGFGRIGRAVFKIALEKGINVVAINDLSDIETLVYLLKYDSVYGKYNKKVEGGKDFIKVNGKKIFVFGEKEPQNLPWKKLGVDVVVESTGFFTDKEGARKHIEAGAKRVLISAPAKNPDMTIVLGVNEKDLKKEHKIISMASCTTNCISPVVKVLNDKFGITKGYLTTIHAYTGDQRLVDAPHKKLRRGRSAGINLVPTTSGAATAVTEVIPSLKGKLDGLAIRAPVACGSICDFVAVLKKSVTEDEVNKAMKEASKKIKNVLEYSEDELVSTDIIGNMHSSIFDSKLTKTNGNMVKVFSWYDNEYGYSNRMVDTLKLL
ncbi:MAG: type I glyceraldehyde-3-phosphate dehydrogenase [Candidatus Pacearchaeota archaeon]|nr:type I glyceraldehyde-3-phosphate dehydrogenase [Candidatus Pacearchaeota archaeon]